MSLREQLEAIREQHGKLTSALVVEEATDLAHPLHDRLEWDDGIAGVAYRLRQAHDLIQSVRIIYKQGDHTAGIRAFQAVRLEEGYVYEPSEYVASEPLLREIVLRDMEREWKQLRKRYGHFAEFVKMVSEDVEDAA